ncbi:CIC11C00000002190 [Sungouiella intermedia]|uniref:Small nuclear ribonucleoprotein G n=1 Tax=Sungouiella intermedia TaxID=45354 RepID=A0A1L0BIS5_9ASCO|nr:CIC11C00000002190 [[Candida] intermedia]
MVSAPELKNYLDKKVSVQLNGSRVVTGTLRGYDVFMNITMADAVESSSGEKVAIGTIVIRGNSIVSVEVCN